MPCAWALRIQASIYTVHSSRCMPTTNVISEEGQGALGYTLQLTLPGEKGVEHKSGS